jgi:hypothetical protein
MGRRRHCLRLPGEILRIGIYFVRPTKWAAEFDGSPSIPAQATGEVTYPDDPGAKASPSLRIEYTEGVSSGSR